MDVCPVNAIEVEEDSIEILDSCRKCGLCAAACPTEAIISPRLAPKNLYDDIVSAATSHETAYVTCTRALKRMPRENEVVVACVGEDVYKRQLLASPRASPPDRASYRA